MKESRFPGHILRERREAMGLSLDDVNRLAHVPVSGVRALESGNLGALPVKAYALGFLQSYCRLLDLEPEPLVEAFHICLNPSARSGRSFAFMSRSSQELGAPRPRWMDELITWSTVCAVILFGWVAYTMVVRPLAANWQQRVEAGSVEIAPPTHFDEKP